ncbi:undecaprenyl-diphosphate phosphatase [Crocinitomix algicola]|uniref:undecaprenyl-diphosphate phosphatase n=1 Tax=Crocinitomix algicola TaxID=1740263 RepID=UPI00082ECA07|nr:undecaprenyl-diphosphate phosphatase [Crocinitomix algicola]
MGILEAIILGIVQGLTEFLPVSSSGHIELANYLMNENLDQDESLLMTTVLHFATATSTIIIFRKEVGEILKGLLKFKWNDELKFSLKIIVSMVPAALVGVLLEDEIASFFGGQIVFVGFMLLLTGALLFLADRAKNTSKDVGFLNAFWIGVSQMIAILPGISRSGATISTSVLLGIDRERAARFSFLMVVPLIFGKMAKDILEILQNPNQYLDTDYTVLGVGFIFSFVTGLFACTWMISLVKKAKLSYFAIYCLIVGIIAISSSFFIQ